MVFRNNGMETLYFIFSRFPIPMSKKLGELTAEYRWFALVYIIFMFFLLPGIFVALTLVDSQGIAMYTFLGLIIFITILVATLKFLQSKESLKKYLPEKLHTFEFLPKFLRSLEPYDQILTGWSCGQKCTAADPEAQPVVKDIKPSNVGALNTTFTMLDEKVY